MPLVVVERAFEREEELGELQAREDAVAWCLEEHGVRFLWTYFARDRRRMVCLYDAPDAEAVRYTQRRAGLPVSAAWAAHRLTEHLGRELDHRLADGATAVVVQRHHDVPPTLDDMARAAEHGAGCFESNQLALIESYVPIGGARTVCLFSAPDAESVRKANRILGLAYESVWPVDVFTAAPR